MNSEAEGSPRHAKLISSLRTPKDPSHTYLPRNTRLVYQGSHGNYVCFLSWKRSSILQVVSGEWRNGYLLCDHSKP